MSLLFYISIIIVLFAIQLIYFKIADHFSIIDKPNERSSHKKITLRGGGIIFYFGAILFFLLNDFQYPFFVAGLTLIAAISFADDISPLSSKLRLPIHFTAMALMFYEWGLFSQPWYYIAIGFIFSVGIINAYNFMDGINGITGAYSISVLLALLFVNLKVNHFIDNELIYFSLIAVMVFNYFNFRKKARCFAGDVGSVTIAFLLVFLLGKLIIQTGHFSYIFFLSVYGVDSVLTIIHRIKLKENIFEAHRKHAYQIMANELKIPHLFVSLFYGILQLIISITTILSPLVAIVLTIWLGVSYIFFKRKYFHLHNY
jgi:UDP-N-acetylmuramyl pentapeptide phosphotransferase/UDP-N-acetylglucosamine-1-phosphate transferase